MPIFDLYLWHRFLELIRKFQKLLNNNQYKFPTIISFYLQINLSKYIRELSEFYSLYYLLNNLIILYLSWNFWKHDKEIRITKVNTLLNRNYRWIFKWFLYNISLDLKSISLISVNYFYFYLDSFLHICY